MLVVAILVRATSPGPVLYRGARLGQGMRPFSIFKFRTLRVGSEGEIGARLLQPRDSFYTPVGRFLKRTKLDEIPQLWNVVRGDMNLVGPRPVRPVFLDEFLATIPGYARRFAMKPGLTGVRQLRGGYFTTPAAKLRYEMWYLRERSVSLDLAILTLTGVKLLNRWITLGGLLFALFIFVSFMPSGILDSFYIYAFGVRMSVAHVAVAAVGAWLLVRRRHADDRIVVYRTPLLVPMLVFTVLALLSAAFSAYHYQAARGAMYYVVTGFLITSGIVNGTFTRSLVERAVQVVAFGAIAIAVVGIVELAMKVGARGDTLVAGWLAGPGITATLGSPSSWPRTWSSASRRSSTSSRSPKRARSGTSGWPAARSRSSASSSRRAPSAWWPSPCPRCWWSGASSPGPSCPAGSCSCPSSISRRRRRCADWRDSVCGPNGALCDLLTKGSWLQLLLGTGARTLGETGLAAEVLDPERSSFHTRLIVETGVLGWLAILWVLATALVSLYRAHRDVTDPRLQALLWAVFCSVVGFVITLQSFSAFENLTLQVFFWGVLGIGIGAAVRFGARQRDYAVVVKLGH
jgi:lipopolysaccharide/colanic/teichoic acid biosynthesis glycosyltransferase